MIGGDGGSRLPGHHARYKQPGQRAGGGHYPSYDPCTDYLNNPMFRSLHSR